MIVETHVTITKPYHRLTVAMMSRITLHLKKQGRLTSVVSDHISLQTIGQSLGGLFHSQLRFARTNGATTTTTTNNRAPNPEVTVTIEELVTRDDDRLASDSDIDDSDISKANSSILPHHHHDTQPNRSAEAKRPEWHQMQRMR